MQDTAMWPAGATYCAQGTVAEDATAGTHVCTMTVTPGAGNEMVVMAWRIQVGNTATAQGPAVAVDDGTNVLYSDFNPSGATDTVANERYQGPAVIQGTVAAGKDASVPSWKLVVSGTMRLQLLVSTAAVSVTQTFAVVCRTRGGKPSTVLADTVGAPVLTLNTDKLF